MADYGDERVGTDPAESDGGVDQDARVPLGATPEAPNAGGSGVPGAPGLGERVRPGAGPAGIVAPHAAADAPSAGEAGAERVVGTGRDETPGKVAGTQL